jgi:hypothetical protein
MSIERDEDIETERVTVADTSVYETAVDVGVDDVDNTPVDRKESGAEDEVS